MLLSAREKTRPRSQSKRRVWPSVGAASEQVGALNAQRGTAGSPEGSAHLTGGKGMTQRGPLEQRERLDFGVRVGLKPVGEVTSPTGSPCLVIGKAGTKATSKDSWEDFMWQCRPAPSLPHPWSCSIF